MQVPGLRKEIEQQVFRLHRERLICVLIRQEGLLVKNSRLVIDLANTLLKSYTYRRP
jgi:hypothetical protein